MADPGYQEGQVLTDQDTGKQIVLKNVDGSLNWVPYVSVGTDIAKSTLPALERTAVGVGTLPATAGYMAAKGANAAGDWAFPDWQQSMVGKTVNALQNTLEPHSYSGVQSSIEHAAGGPFYSAQTNPGKMWEAAVGAAPLALLAPEATIPNVARAMASGALSEAAGQATRGTPYEIPARLAAGAGAYSAPGALWRSGITAATPRAAMAQTLENSGVPVSAADITGSRFLASLEGQPPAGQAGKLSDVMQEMGGIQRPPGNVQPFSQLVEGRARDLSSAVQGLEANTAIPATPALRQQLASAVANHLANYSGTSLENPAIAKALDDYDALSQGGALNGKNYHDLSDQWSNSGDPVLRGMSKTLDTAMDSATANSPYANAWNTWRQNWADLQGMKAASQSAGGEATLKPLSPDAVVNAMYKRTPMRNVAEAGQGILGSRPQPYSASPDSAAHIVGSLLGGAAALHGVSQGGLPGAEEGVFPFLFGEAVPRAAAVVSSPIQKGFRSAGGQNFLRNMDPRVAAALLANEGVSMKEPAQTAPQ